MTDQAITIAQLNSEHSTLQFLIWGVYEQLFNRRLKVNHSLTDGTFCSDMEEREITNEMAQQIHQSVLDILNSDTPIELIELRRHELIEYFTKRKFPDKIGLLKAWQDEKIPCIRCGKFLDYTLKKMTTDKNRLKIFEIRPYDRGLVIRYPLISDPHTIPEWRDPKVLHHMFDEYAQWAHLLNVDYVAKLNQKIYERKIDDVKWVAEGLHSKKLTLMADKLTENFSKKKVITIAGPSSSNKTTFALRLQISLRVNGYESLVIGMDDFYKNRDQIPVEADGQQDFEVITALDIPLLSQRVKALLNGESVPARRFDFVKGVGYDNEKEQLKLSKNQFLIIEGIHGLNPSLLEGLGRENVTPIYVSALTPVNIDSNHRFSTSDLRLIRRMIRDYRYRGYSPRSTLRRWPSVRKGEVKNIFPYQENAEMFFNSSLVYELPVLLIYGKGLLAEATIPEEGEDPNTPEALLISTEARRLLGLLNFFYPVSVEVVPHISLIREFVGGSDFQY